MSDSPSQSLHQLEALRFTFGRGLSARKRRLLDELAGATLPDSDEVLRLHDLLCFMRAYPDDRAVLSLVCGLLEGFTDRPDLERDRSELADSGIAGTEIHFRFYWFTLCWLTARWGERLVIDWSAFSARQRALLDRRLPMLMPYCETLAIEEAMLPTRDWIERLKGPDETDAEFVVRRFEALTADPLPREAIFEEIDIPFTLHPGPDTPCTTRSQYDRSPVVYQSSPLVRGRETFRKELDATPPPARSVPRREARRLIELGRGLMVTRSRDLDVFVHAAEDDVRIMGYPEGFEFVCMGTTPERRQMLDACYGFLMLRNGVPIGYFLSASLFGSSEVAYNVSPAFRGAEAAHLYGRCLNAVRHLFGADTFAVDPYQMGYENTEGLKSGAWWFYYKLGFRPRDQKIARMAEAEQQRARGEPGYRSSIPKLNRLSSVNMYLSLGDERDEIIGEFARENVGLHIVGYLAERFGSDREKGLAVCSREAARMLGVRTLAGFTPGERLAWERWAPLLTSIPGLDGWSARDKSAAVRVVRAKGGRRESDFVRRFDRHLPLRSAVYELSR